MVLVKEPLCDVGLESLLDAPDIRLLEARIKPLPAVSKGARKR